MMEEAGAGYRPILLNEAQKNSLNIYNHMPHGFHLKTILLCLCVTKNLTYDPNSWYLFWCGLKFALNDLCFLNLAAWGNENRPNQSMLVKHAVSHMQRETFHARKYRRAARKSSCLTGIIRHIWLNFLLFPLSCISDLLFVFACC